LLVGPRSRAGHRNPFGPVRLPNLPPYYRLLRPCAPPRYSHPRGDRPLGLLPSHRGDRFPRSAQEPDAESRRLHAGCGSDSNQAILRTSPGLTTSSRFRHRRFAFDTSSAVRSGSSLCTAPDGILFRLFPQRSPQRLLTDAACGGLKPAPDRRLRGTYPHLLCSIAPPFVRSWRTVISKPRWSHRRSPSPGQNRRLGIPIVITGTRIAENCGQLIGTRSPPPDVAADILPETAASTARI
jgi:hypothetical protein